MRECIDNRSHPILHNQNNVMSQNLVLDLFKKLHDFILNTYTQEFPKIIKSSILLCLLLYILIGITLMCC